MAQKQVKTFETTDEAVTYLYNNPEFNGDLRVLEEEEEEDELPETYPRDGVTIYDGREVREVSYNPDLPVQQNDPKHELLWFLNSIGADAPYKVVKVEQIPGHIKDFDYAIGPVVSAAVRAGYANKRKNGKTPYLYITPKGKSLIRDWGTPVQYVMGQNVLDV